ncbi:MAG TPA: sodium:proton antiporter [Gemmataceae bacterium]|nr:sodium:proton antiporter [Gemmataceae bacterium]
MTTFELAACLVVLAAVFSYLNHTLLKLPAAIGAMSLTLSASLLLVLAGLVLPGLEGQARALVARIDLQQAFLHGMLGFMLFAGSLHLNLSELNARKWPVAVLSTLGVVVSTAVVGLLTWGVLNALGVPARLMYCLLFGALISPTDPIAVMAILRQAGIPRAMEVTIAGESLFNDGVGVVVFLAMLEIATGAGGLDVGHLAWLFLWEAVGGAALGFLLGWVVYRMLRSVDHYQVEVLLSLALVAGGYALVNRLHMSGPIAMVVAGLLIGNVGRMLAMSPATVDHLDVFWELIDEVLNAVLFVLIGLEVLALTFSGRYLLAGLLAIPTVLLARLVSVGVPLTVMNRWGGFAPYTTRVLTWGGLRGGISVALALSIPMQVEGQPVAERDVLIALTYVVVVFSILVQGLTVGPLTRRWLRGRPPQPKLHPDRGPAVAAATVHGGSPG